jgi:hypothetical protein
MDDAGATTLLRVEGLGIAVRARCAYVDVLWGEGDALDAGEMGALAVFAAGVSGADDVVVVACIALVVTGVARGHAWSPSSLVVTASLCSPRDGERLRVL